MDKLWSNGRFSTREYPKLVVTFVALLLVVALFASVGIGAVSIKPSVVAEILLNELGMSLFAEAPTKIESSVLLNVRLPRVLVGLMSGGLLAITGVLMQAFFRNPLADPALIGVSTGGAFGAVSVIVLGSVFLGGFNHANLAIVLPVAAFLGSLTACGVIFSLAKHNGTVNVTVMLLCGIAVNAVAGAGIGFMSFLADDAQLRDITFWSLGSLGAANWSHVQAMLLPAVLLGTIAVSLAMPLNAVLLGDDEAGHLGFAVEKLKMGILLLTCIGAGTVVATCGVIGFVGLIAPHASRLLVGPNHVYVIPLSAISGACLLITADIIARTLVSPAELPIGVLTALIGGPVFLWLLRQRSHRGQYA